MWSLSWHSVTKYSSLPWQLIGNLVNLSTLITCFNKLVHCTEYTSHNYSASTAIISYTLRTLYISYLYIFPTIHSQKKKRKLVFPTKVSVSNNSKVS